MPSEIVIFGPPGTGKTEAGILLSRQWFQSGIPTNQVAYLSFTRAAALEAVDRLSDGSIGGDEIELEYPYFRTIHSVAWRALREDHPDLRVLKPAHMRLFAQEHCCEGLYSLSSWEDIADAYRTLGRRAKNHWDKAFLCYNLSRLCSQRREDFQRFRVEPCRQTYSAPNIGPYSSSDYREFVRRYEKWKQTNGLIDFTDMLEYALSEMRPLEGVEYVVVDEAQDLSPVMISIVERIFEGARAIFWIGDDDQCIHSYAGSSAEQFLRKAARASKRLQLRQTHRFGEKIVRFSNAIIRTVRNRQPKEVIGHPGRENVLRREASFQPIPLEGDETALILHRHVQGCHYLASLYEVEGLPFVNERGRSPLEAQEQVRAWKTMRDLSVGKSLSGKAAEEFVTDFVRQSVEEKGVRTSILVRGGKKKMGGVKGNVRLADLDGTVFTPDGIARLRRMDYSLLLKGRDNFPYYEKLTRNGHKLDDYRTIITTIHGSKGRQAEKVVLFSEINRICRKRDPDGEDRVAYVGATRTKGELTICEERQPKWRRERYLYPINWKGEVRSY